MGFAQCQHEFFFLVLYYQLDEVGETAVGERNFAFAIYDVFLQVERYGFRLARCIHGFGNRNPGLFANVEKTIDCRARSEDDGRMSQYFNTLASEFLERYPYYADERHIFDFSLVFLG